MRRYLYEYSTEELVAELASRREGPRERGISRWCDQCVNFKISTNVEDMPSKVDNCTKGHRMDFRMPNSHPSDSDAWGFYRLACRDWCARPETPPPAAPAEPPPPRPPMGGKPRRVR